MKKIVLALFVVVFSLSCIAAHAAESRSFGIVYPGLHPFWIPIGEAAEKYAETKGWTVTANDPDSSDAARQIEIIENMVSMGLDGIAITPLDESALRGVIDRLIDQGVVVICLESDCPGSKRMAYIGTDNYKAGRHMGSVIARELNGKGKIIVMTGLPTQPSLNQRMDGIRDYLSEKYPDIEVADLQSHEGDVTKAVTVTENMIQGTPDFDAIIGLDANTGPAFISVWKANGWTGKDHMIIVFDDMPDNIQGLKDGFIKAIVSQREGIWGESVLNMMNDLMDGKKVPDYTDTGSVEITLDNISSYMDDPFWVEK